MALMEVLVSGAVLAAATLAFLAVLREARNDLAAARTHAQAARLAAALLREAEPDWASAPSSGQRDGFAWRRACSASPASPRLVLVSCTVSVARMGTAPLTLERVWAAPRQTLPRP